MRLREVNLVSQEYIASNVKSLDSNSHFFDSKAQAFMLICIKSSSHLQGPEIEIPMTGNQLKTLRCILTIKHNVITCSSIN